jgi:hypothetical protein
MFKSRGQARARVAALTRRRVEAVIRSRWSPRLRRTMFYVVTGQYVFLQSARTDRAKVRALRFPARIIGAPARR